MKSDFPDSLQSTDLNCNVGPPLLACRVPVWTWQRSHASSSLAGLFFAQTHASKASLALFASQLFLVCKPGSSSSSSIYTDMPRHHDYYSSLHTALIDCYTLYRKLIKAVDQVETSYALRSHDQAEVLEEAVQEELLVQGECLRHPPW
jgi:hypothetical protein